MFNNPEARGIYLENKKIVDLTTFLAYLEFTWKIEIQISFLNSYVYRIKKYLKTGEGASDIISNLKEKSRRIRKDD